MRRPLAVRVLVLDPSAPRRLRLQRLLEQDPLLQLAGQAGNAEQAIDAAGRKACDVILAGPGGSPAETLACIRQIMQARPLPIVVVAAGGPGGERQAFQLVDAGALAVLHDPGPAETPQHAEALRELLQALRLMAEVKVVRRWPRPAPPSAPPATRPPARTRALPPHRTRGVDIVAVGASTGGPVVLKELLCRLPAGFPVPIVIVQHMAGGFLPALAEWLSAACTVPTEVAGPGCELRPGRAYLAPDDLHLRVAAGGRLAFEAGQPVNGHRPSVSTLFASVAALYGPAAIGILLTGMGKDGAAELKLMKDAGALTIVQDAASSVVHGMPGEAIRCGAACYVMSPGEIAAALPALVARGEKETP